ncbi:polysaccharide lyase family 7 protein [Lentzea terrae]|uniref:polysaccharide lyase family 7 protein n=1 Tax=Lentzea terrae TaxID=2200761 RepID=UPI0018E4E082|nr:polysaccharide lyase family 7 protein [Lentzea terrae]
MKSSRSVVALAVFCAALGATPVQAAVQHTLDWESTAQQRIPAEPPPGWEAQYDADLRNPGGRPQASIARSPEPVRAGASAVRFELDRNNPGPQDGPRAELAGDELGGERWYGFSIYLPESWKADRAADIVTQWHHTLNTGSPPLAIETQGGNWRISQNWEDSEKDTPVGAYQVGRWTDWVVHVRWSAGSDGLLEIWKDGVPVPGFEHKTGKNSYRDPRAYMKIGIYKWPWKDQQSDTTNRVMYHDELRIADASGSYQQVAPPRTTPPPADGLPVTEVTALSDDGNVPANTVDNNLATRWSAHGEGQWIRYDLGATKNVGGLAIAWHQGDRRTSRFDIETSVDGTTWTAAAAGLTSRLTLAQESYDIPDVEARYVRIVGHGNSSGNGWNSITETDVLGAGTPGGDCRYPAQALDLENWKITLPVDDPDREGRQPLEITQPRLRNYVLDPWFAPVEACKAVRFRAPVTGVTTENSKNPRSELREMTNGGRDRASWSSTSGTHTMVIDQAITRLPEGRPQVVAGQIHDADDDVTVFRLVGRKLYLTDEDNTQYKLIADDYEPGTRFQVKFEASEGKIRAYYNGVLKDTRSKSFSGGYFKAGAYTQANCGNASPCADSNYGEVVVYGVTVTHS